MTSPAPAGSPAPFRFGAIDGLRAIAVLAVLASHAAMHSGHARSLTWFSLGSRGVDLFFVISGFCLAYPTLRRVRSGLPHGFDVGTFAKRRLWRIAPPFYVALGLFALLSLTAFGLPSAFAAPGPLELAREALFFTDGSPYNGSFWTLGIEMRWYLLFPLLLFAYVRLPKLFFAAIGALYVAYAAFALPLDAGTLPCFMLGIVAADLALSGRLTHAWLPAALAGAILGCIALALVLHAPSWDTDHADPLWHLAAFLAVLLAVNAAVARKLSSAPLAFIGVASYSIYLVHEPIVAWLEKSALPPPVAAVLALAAGLGFWWLVERPAVALAHRRDAARSAERLANA